MAQHPSPTRTRKWFYRGIISLMIVAGSVQAYYLEQSWSQQQRAETRLRGAVRGSDQGLWSWPVPADNEDWLQSSWWTGPNFHRVLGWGKRPPLDEIQDYISLIHPDDQEAVLSEIRESLAEKRPFTIDYQIRNGKGEYIWVRGRGGLQSIDGQTVLSGSIVNITREKRERLRALMIVKSAPAAIVMCGEDREITIFNDKAEELFGVTHEEMLGKSTDVLIPIDYRSRHGLLFRQAATKLREGEANTYFTNDGVRAAALHSDGSLLPVILNIRGVRYRDKIEFVAVIYPIEEPPREPGAAADEKIKPLDIQEEANAREFRSPKRRRST